MHPLASGPQRNLRLTLLDVSGCYAYRCVQPWPEMSVLVKAIGTFYASGFGWSKLNIQWMPN